MRFPIAKIVLGAVLGATLIAVQYAMSPLPNIELVSLLIIIYACVFGGFALYPVLVFITVEGLLYGFGIWWISYLYVWPLLVFIACVLQKHSSRILWAIVSGGFGLLFGALCAIPYFFIAGSSGALAYWIAGIYFDLLHFLGNFTLAFFLFTPLYKSVQRVARISFLTND